MVTEIAKKMHLAISKKMVRTRRKVGCNENERRQELGEGNTGPKRESSAPAIQAYS
jgi:hypothetical protein